MTQLASAIANIAALTHRYPFLFSWEPSMSIVISRRAACLYAVSALGLASLPVRSQPAFPARPIRLIVPFAVGGSTDLIARVIAEALRKEFGQAVIVENRTGAAGMIGTEAIATAAPDGYSIGIGTDSTWMVNPLFSGKAAKANERLRPFNLVSLWSMLAVHPSFPAKDFAGFVAELKRKPGVYSCGVPGVGSSGHLFVEAFNEALGVKIVAVPYRGNGPAMTDSVAGVVQVVMDSLPSAMPHVRTGKLVPLAVSGAARQPELPRVPTYTELGHADLNERAVTRLSLVIPNQVPAPIADALRAAAARAVQQPDVQRRLQEIGAQSSISDEQASRQLIASVLEKNRALVKRANITAL
ncbi:tripartite tricarboxylate transporter substrate-binding protein [Cupriavidus necator]